MAAAWRRQNGNALALARGSGVIGHGISHLAPSTTPATSSYVGARQCLGAVGRGSAWRCCSADLDARRFAVNRHRLALPPCTGNAFPVRFLADRRGACRRQPTVAAGAEQPYPVWRWWYGVTPPRPRRAVLARRRITYIRWRNAV